MLSLSFFQALGRRYNSIKIHIYKKEDNNLRMYSWGPEDKI
jgi:hypothetical protein